MSTRARYDCDMQLSGLLYLASTDIFSSSQELEVGYTYPSCGVLQSSELFIITNNNQTLSKVVSYSGRLEGLHWFISVQLTF